MNRAAAEKKLAALGFEIDWSVTGRMEGYWSGTIDAVGRGQIDGDCRGAIVNADTAYEWYDEAVSIAEMYTKGGPNRQCIDPDCEFHADCPITENV
jgi:hypothetical protein